MAKEVEALTVLLAARTAEFERGMASAERRIDKVERRMRGSTALIERDARRMQQRVQQSFDQVGKSFSLSGVALGGIGLAAITKEALAYSDAWTKAKNSLAVAGLEGARQSAVLDQLFASAQRNSVGIGSLSELYGKATQNAAALGAGQADLIKFTDGIAVALKASGASAESASGALMQLSQLLGSGIVRAEEFNSVNEGAPTILKAVATGMDGAGGSISKLRTMVLAGTVTSKQFFDAFLKGKPVIDDMAARAMPTLANATTRINNALTRYVGENAGAQGATRALINGLNYLADNFEETADVALKFAAVIAAALVGRAIGGMIASLGSAAGAVSGLAKAMVALRTGGGLGGLVAAFGGLGAAAGPIGAILGVAAAAGLYFYQKSSQAAEGAQEAADAIRNLGISANASAADIAKLAGELEKLTQAQIRARIENDKTLAAQQAAELSDALPGRGRRARGASTPSARAIGELGDIANAFKAQKISLAEFKRQTDALAAKFPEFAPQIAKAQDKAEELAKTFVDLKAAGDALANQQKTQAPSAFNRATGAGLDAAGGVPNVGDAGATDLADASKTDYEKSVDKQTDELVKAYEKNGQKVTDAVRDALRDVARGIVNAQDARKQSEAEFSASAAGNAFDLIKAREGFRAKAYWDVNAFRAGFGSDTTTDAGGNVSKVTKDTVVSVEDAIRDLKRRIVEFQTVVRKQVGSGTFDALSKEQQAALTSIAYNYGKLPDNIVKAINGGGSTQDVAKAIRDRAGDNGGVNRGRRNEEADLYAGNATPQAKERDQDVERSRAAKRRAEDDDLETEALRRKAEAIKNGALAQEYFDAQLERSRYIAEAKRALEDEGVDLTPERIAAINSEADAVVAAAQRKFDAEKKVQDVVRDSKGVREAEEFFAENATSAFTDIITGASTAQQAMKKLIGTFIDAAIQATLLGKGPLAGIFGTASGTGGLGGLFGAFFGGGASGGKARGGRVSKGQVYPVGENGREFFAPGENGRIIPESKMPRLATVSAQPARSPISPQVTMKINLAGANGDTTIERIARQAAAAAGKEAYRQAVRDSARASGKVKYNQDVLGQPY